MFCHLRTSVSPTRQSKLSSKNLLRASAYNHKDADNYTPGPPNQMQKFACDEGNQNKSYGLGPKFQLKLKNDENF